MPLCSAVLSLPQHPTLPCAQAAAVASIPSAAMALPCSPNCGTNGQEVFVVKGKGVAGEDGTWTANTSDKRAPTPSFSGKYTDPQHPGMLRKVSKSGKFVTISGTDEDGSKFKLSGSIEGRVLKVDFTPKGGPSDLEAVAGFSPKDGSIIIKFPVCHLPHPKSPTPPRGQSRSNRPRHLRDLPHVLPQDGNVWTKL